MRKDTQSLHDYLVNDALPEGYHVELVHITPEFLHVGVHFVANAQYRDDVHIRGTRIFDIYITPQYAPGYDAPQGVLLAAQGVTDWGSWKTPRDVPQPPIEFDDITTLMQVMLTRHRLGVKV